MKKMIWIVNSDCVYDCAEEEPRRMAFLEKDDALKAFKRECDELKEAFGSKWECEEGDYFLDMWLDGDYCTNHARVIMEQIELN